MNTAPPTHVVVFDASALRFAATGAHLTVSTPAGVFLASVAGSADNPEDVYAALRSARESTLTVAHPDGTFTDAVVGLYIPRTSTITLPGGRTFHAGTLPIPASGLPATYDEAGLHAGARCFPHTEVGVHTTAAAWARYAD